MLNASYVCLHAFSLHQESPDPDPGQQTPRFWGGSVIFLSMALSQSLTSMGSLAWEKVVGRVQKFTQPRLGVVEVVLPVVEHWHWAACGGVSAAWCASVESASGWPAPGCCLKDCSGCWHCWAGCRTYCLSCSQSNNFRRVISWDGLANRKPIYMQLDMLKKC
jgi:hypothetical protein